MIWDKQVILLFHHVFSTNNYPPPFSHDGILYRIVQRFVYKVFQNVAKVVCGKYVIEPTANLLK